MDMTPERWLFTRDYLTSVFGGEGPVQASIRRAAAEADLAPIAISADVGRLLELLVRTTPARLALDVGTLGGYSAAWIAQGLGPGGRVITIECDPHAAAVAREKLTAFDLPVEIELGPALEVLARLADQLGDHSVDFAFVDADKLEYEAYWEILGPMIRPGGMFVADNVLGTGGWWIDQLEHEERQAIDRFNRRVAADAAFTVAGLSVREGLLIARRL